MSTYEQGVMRDSADKSSIINLRSPTHDEEGSGNGPLYYNTQAAAADASATRRCAKKTAHPSRFTATAMARAHSFLIYICGKLSAAKV
jgi:hypothetical protein